jgi:polyhydroxyalkanoate synthesis regulator phasin
MKTPVQKIKDSFMESGQLTDNLDDFLDEMLKEEKQWASDIWDACNQRILSEIHHGIKTMVRPDKETFLKQYGITKTT